MDKYKSSKVVIFALGLQYQMQKEFLENYFHICGYSDSKVSVDRDYIPCERLKEIEFEYVYITSSNHYVEIKSMLVREYGISESKVICQWHLLGEILPDSLSNGGIGDNCVHMKVGNAYFNITMNYQDVYDPIYNPHRAIKAGGPDIYNKEGRKLELFFLRDAHTAHDPYSGSRYFEWDRYNYCLSTHFYTHTSIMQTMGKPQYKYAVLGESEGIVPNDYRLFRANKAMLENEFEAVFTYDYDILHTFSNAKFLPFSANPWYGSQNITIRNDGKNYEKKTKPVSIVASDKYATMLHRLRRQLAVRCDQEHLADAYGASVGRKVRTEEIYQKYRFSIVIENNIAPYYFTEKITNCFAAQTIPIYVGASRIHEFFNEDGIIRVSHEELWDKLEQILSMCTEREYLSRLSAVLDNYNRVAQYYNMWDYMYEKYFITR